MERFHTFAKGLIKTILLLTVCSLAVDATDKIVVKGSDTLGAKLVPQLAEEFKSLNQDVVFEIAAEGSTTGLSRCD
jgi:phosphate transport system substrate-binding protein